AFCTKEVTYITGSIFVTFLFFRWLWEYTARPAGGNVLTERLQELLKNRRPLWMSTGIVFGIILVLYTTVFSHPQGFLDAFTKSLSYWLGQHEVQRGSQPVYFYAGLIPLYETLAFLGSIVGLIYFSFVKNRQNRAWHFLAYLILLAAWWLFTAQGTQTFGLIFSLLLIALGVGMVAYFSFTSQNLFVPFLLVWTLAAFSDYSFAGERMPWLILHPLLPMMLLTGHLLGEWWEHWRKQRVWLVTAFILLASMMLHNTSLLNFYVQGANPAELLVYVQSSTDVPQVVRQITNMSKRLTGGLEMKITCEDYCSWPFAWYLRDFKFVGYPKYTATQSEGSIEENPVIISGVEMAAPGHDDRVAELLAEKYVAQRYKLRVWWAPDSRMFLSDTFAGKAQKAWRLFMYKEPWSGLGSYDMIVYVRKDVAHLYWSNAE
ncbi:TIGR03663 family protein, partial [candidate division FCPU426 bacterium]|nr:TIGR03663 family protein [candidate division FCPU426 bacterium]